MDDCWLWDGSYYPNGYGQVWVPAWGRGTQAHRFVYEARVGKIPEGKQLDHLCRMRGCVNPKHLRVVSCRENIMEPRTNCLARLNAVKTHCKRGHEFNSENAYMWRGYRHCRSCKATEKRERRRRNSARGRGPACAAGDMGTADVATDASQFRSDAKRS